MSSRESVFYDEDAEVKAAPMPSGDKWALFSSRALHVLSCLFAGSSRHSSHCLVAHLRCMH